MTCIYCKERSPSARFSQREHVIPESFGLFRSNLVLHGKVCDACNSFFGRTLDMRLARDTYEGLDRYSLGIKSSRDYKHLGNESSLVIRVGEGRFKNAFAFFEYSEQQKRVVLRPLEQIGLKRNGSEEYDFYMFDDFPSADEIDLSVYDLRSPKSLKVLSERLDEATRLLQSIGVSFVPGSAFEADNSTTDILLQVSSTVNDIVRRAIAKIAFNYVAYWNTTEILMDVAFDPARLFVRYGQSPALPIVHLDDTPILGDEPRDGQVPVGHIVTVGWNDYRDAVLAKVSLFNTMTYKVILAFGYKELQVVVGRGSFWNVADMSVLQL